MVVLPHVKKVYQNQLFVSFSGGEFFSDTENMPYKLLSDKYGVTVNGEACPVRFCRVSAIPFNRPWPGAQRPYDQSEEAGFIHFRSDESVRLCVTCERDFKQAVVRPLSADVTPQIEGNEITFTLKRAGSYVLELDGWHHALHIFFDPIKAWEGADKATYSFGPGVHFPGVVALRDNESVYIDDAAVVFGSIYADGAENIRIFGGGTVDNSCEARVTEHCYEPFTKGCFRIYNCKNVTVEGIMLTDSSTWSMSMFNCDGVSVDNVKIVGQWRYNTDGIDIVNSRNVLLKNSFIRAFDDVISIKGIYDCPYPIENIKTDNCVLWCGWGHTCELGVETEAPEYRNVIFENCDIVHASGYALAVANGSYADCHDIVFKNMNVEFQKDDLPEVFQRSIDQQYDGFGKEGKHQLIKLSNSQFAVRTMNTEGVIRKKAEIPGNIRNVRFENICVFAEEGISAPTIRLESIDEHVCFEAPVIDGLYWNGERQTDLSRFSVFENNSDPIKIR